jgi:hypothetical protein
MLSKETESKLLALGLDVAKFIEAIKSEEEVSITIPELVTKSKFDEYGKNRYEEGKKVFSEIKAKELKEKFALEVEGKDIETVIEAAISNKVNEATKGSAEWMEEKKALQKLLKDREKELKEKDSLFENKLFIFEQENKLKSLLPDDVPLGKDLIVKSFMLENEIKREDGRAVILKSGQVIKDDVLNPVDPDSYFKTWLDEKKIIKHQGSEGGDSGGGGSSKKFSKLSDFMDYCAKQGISPMGEQGQTILKEGKAENFVYQ